MDVVAKRLFENEGKVRRLRTVGVCIGSVVTEAFKRVVEGRLNKPNVFADAWKVSKLQRRAVLTDDIHEGHVIEQQLVIPNLEFLLRKLKGLLNQLPITLHVMPGIRLSRSGNNAPAG